MDLNLYIHIVSIFHGANGQKIFPNNKTTGNVFYSCINWLHRRLQGALVVSWITWFAKEAWRGWFDTLGFQYLQLECMSGFGTVGTVGKKTKLIGRFPFKTGSNHEPEKNGCKLSEVWMAKACKAKEVSKKTGWFLKSLKPPVWTSCLDKVSVLILFCGWTVVIHPDKLTSFANFRKNDLPWTDIAMDIPLFTIRNKSTNGPLSIAMFDYRR